MAFRDVIFQLPISDISITLDDVSCTYIFPIRGKLRDRSTLSRDEVSEMMVTYLGADLTDAQNEVVDTKGAHARFKFLEDFHKDQLQMVVDANGDDMQVKYH